MTMTTLCTRQDCTKYTPSPRALSGRNMHSQQDEKETGKQTVRTNKQTGKQTVRTNLTDKQSSVYRRSVCWGHGRNALTPRPCGLCAGVPEQCTRTPHAPDEIVYVGRDIRQSKLSESYSWTETDYTNVCESLVNVSVSSGGETVVWWKNNKKEIIPHKRECSYTFSVLSFSCPLKLNLSFHI